jgi:hypothetical protein
MKIAADICVTPTENLTVETVDETTVNSHTARLAAEKPTKSTRPPNAEPR